MNQSRGALLVLVCANAHAFVVHDVDSLALPVDGEQTCVVVPAEAADPKICGHANLEAMRKLIEQNMAPLENGGAKLLSVAVLPHDRTISIALITRTPLTGREPLASDSIRTDLLSTLAGIGDSFGHELVPTVGSVEKPYEPIKIAGTAGIRSLFVSASPLLPVPGIDRVLYYRIFAPSNSFFIAVVTSRAEQERVSALIESWLGRATITPLSPEQLQRFDQLSYYELGYRHGLVLGRILFVLATTLLFLGISRVLAKRFGR